jgi:asparagine synthase (glutamine-hydrolysing)
LNFLYWSCLKLCGIAGIVSGVIDQNERERIVRSMVRALIHRGPDEQAVVSDGAATFGVARLSIVDRREGQQPMKAAFHRREGLIAYNGETYNFQDLRNRLAREGFAFQTQSDTEAVLASHLLWGIDAVEYLDGMYAYSIWNPARSQLLMVRDRLGIKPLYFVNFGVSIAFASEPKALFCLPWMHTIPNPTAILEYFLHGAAFASGYVTSDRSFFEGIYSIEPGHLLVWEGERSSQKKYWSPLQSLGPLRDDKGEAQLELKDALDESVRSMLIGEVPVGTALSGGLDSSILTALAAREMDEPLVSACITYRDDHDDPDAHHAALLSNHLNDLSAGSHSLAFTHLTEDNYLDSLDEMIRAFDEPHWEIRQLAMFQNYHTLAHLNRTIVLTGEGADELCSSSDTSKNSPVFAPRSFQVRMISRRRGVNACPGSLICLHRRFPAG